MYSRSAGARRSLHGTASMRPRRTLLYPRNHSVPMSTLQKLDRTPMQSKKFIAFFLCLVVSRICLIVMIQNAVSPTVLVTALLCSTFVDVGYILGQAALDIYVRGIAQVRRGKDETED